MIYRTLWQCIHDLEAKGDLIRIADIVDPYLEIGAIQRRVFKAKGPALLFTRVKGCSFPMLGNLFGTSKRVQYLFQDTLKTIEQLFHLSIHPFDFFKHPIKYRRIPKNIAHVIPRRVKKGPILSNQSQINKLPLLISWPEDGGAFITLPQVYSESVNQPGWLQSNIGMYRIQLTGEKYIQNQEIGLHYQIHRGIGYHHAEAIAQNKPFYVNIFIGGTPAMTLASVMPLPEGLPEIAFAGLLAGFRMPLIYKKGLLPIPAESDFCIIGEVIPNKLLPEGPFGDHLGYYSQIHDFPVIRVHKVFHRSDAVWPFTTVGRPPQEDSILGDFIHQITAPLVSSVFKGIHEVRAVDAAGVHPLLLAVGSERYVPFAAEKCPQELLTGAFSLLGNTQTSLTKYLIIAAQEDDPQPNVNNITAFLTHCLERVHLKRDLHFITRTTMDTLDYSGISLNQGSKVIIAAIGKPRRTLGRTIPESLKLPSGFCNPYICIPGVIAIQGPSHQTERDTHDTQIVFFCEYLKKHVNCLESFPLIIIVDDSEFTSKTRDNFLWVTFTRSDPATDVYGVGSFIHCKHWGCTGPLVIDARLKSHHAPPLEDNPDIEKQVDNLGAPGGPLHKII